MKKPEDVLLQLDIEKKANNAVVSLTELLADKFTYIYFVDPDSGEYTSFANGEIQGVSSVLLQEGKGDDFFRDTVEDIDCLVYEADKKKAWNTFKKGHLQKIAGSGKAEIIEMRLVAGEQKDIVWVRDKIACFCDAAGRKRIVVGIENITEEKKTKEKLLQVKEIERQSQLDILTGCKNRMAISWAYDCEFKNQSSLGVVSCDLNGLKKVNDKHGHEAGDRFICDVANELKEIFGAECVYRVGGDEFIVFLLSVTKQKYEQMVETLREQCRKKQLSISLGCIFTTNVQVTFDSLLKDADAKMYEEKKNYYRRVGIDRRNRSEMFRNREFVDAMVDYGSLCYLALKINLTENSYEIIHVMEGYDTSFRSACPTLADFLLFPVKAGVMHEEDANDYLRYTSLDFLKNYSRRSHGNLDHWVRYRSKYKRKDYHLIEVQFFWAREYSDENQKGYLILKDMGMPFDPDRMLSTEVLKSLSEGFDSIFYADFDKDLLYPYRISRDLSVKMRDLLQSIPRYTDAVSMFLTELVCEKDRNLMENICSRSHIAEQLKFRKSFSQEFRVHVFGNEVFYRIKFSNMGEMGALKHCIIGFENINSEKLFPKEYKKSGEKILIVDDSELNRSMLRQVLDDSYSLIEAENGEEALKILNQHYEEIALVLTDLVMPKCDGFELIRRMKGDRKFSDIPIVVTTALEEEENRIQCLSLGASDFIAKPYNDRLIRARVSSIVKLRGVTETLNRIEIDTVTGLYTREAFFEYAQTLLDRNPDTEYTLILSDILGFKEVNQKYGTETGNRLLRYLAQSGTTENYRVLIGGRIGSDSIAYIVGRKNFDETMQNKYISEVRKNSPVPNIVVKYGFYTAGPSGKRNIHQMTEKARIALDLIKEEYGKYFSFYDKSMGERARITTLIVQGMEEAIRQKQFTVYYQPKVDTGSGQIIGAEALVRWEHPKLGFINPGEFIPLFEKNGFITELDKYVWERVCQDMAGFLSLGDQFHVSVNVSRRDFSDPGLAEYIIQLADYYGVPHRMLHIEVTETAYTENADVIRDTIRKLHEQGFVIELDDFGTGYSSLTALNGMDIDILKLDLSIMRSYTEQSDKNVLNFTMNLAKMMQVQTVQEGVETEEELKRVKALGCNYVQGYYFSRPLPMDEFCEYVQKQNKDEEKT